VPGICRNRALSVTSWGAETGWVEPDDGVAVGLSGGQADTTVPDWVKQLVFVRPPPCWDMPG